MVLENLELTNFKLHKQSVLNFSEKLNYIVGGNGHGKTTVLEAIYYLSTTKGFGQTNDADAVTFGENFFEIKGTFKSLTNNRARIHYDKTERRKRYFLNGKLISKPAEIIGKFPVVILSLADHEITLGAPSDRRRFVDSIISQSSGTYLKILLEYNKTLKHRAALLQKIRDERNDYLLEELDAWTETLVKLGGEIILHRKNFTEEFTSYVKKAYEKIMAETEIPEINYAAFTSDFNAENVFDKFKIALKERRQLEIARAANLAGPHRDDFEFYLNGKSLKKFGSQGQHKTFQIALRFAQFYYIKDKSGETPLFLMDDIFGELDSYRSGKIRDYLDKVGQAFITMTDFTKYERLQKNGNDNLIIIENGKHANA
jgi:DNA replication and repair protein RecF